MSARSVIRPFRSQQRLTEEQASEIWDNLRSAMRQIYNANASKLSFEELYRNSYNLVLHKYGDLLYNGVKQEIAGFLKEMVEKIAKASDDTLLSAVTQAWRSHTLTMAMVRDILMYMDRAYCQIEKKTLVYDLGLMMFCTDVAQHVQIKSRILHMLLGNISNERAGELIDREVVGETLDMMKTLQIYEDDFEETFLQISREFYQQEAIRFIEANTCPGYLLKAETRLEEEKQRARNYLRNKSEMKIIKVVEECMIEPHAATLVGMPNSGCQVLLREDKIKDLGRMYKLFRLKNCRNFIRVCMTDYVKACGDKIVSDDASNKKPVDFVTELLGLQNKYDKIIKESFHEDKGFNRCLKESFESFVNKNNLCSQYLSMYLDELMRRKGVGQGNDDAELGIKIDNCIILFRYIQDKDIFESYYKQQLAKRLLNGRSSSEDSETLIIKKLKTECGQGYTSKLEGMFKDMKLSKQTTEQYLAIQDQSLGVEISVTILTAGFWPIEPPSACNFPPMISERCDEFIKFYVNLHSGRRVTWQPSLGNADIRGVFPAQQGLPERKHEFTVSTYQMLILLLLNEREHITFSDIETQTGIAGKELQRHILSLCAPKFKVLVKDSAKGVEGSTKFWINYAFTSKMYRIKIPLISTRQTGPGEAAGSVQPHVDEDRKHLIEAAIVRIMKSRKTLKHTLLIAEVTKQMAQRFRPTPQSIKKRIESLIEREYLERMESDLNEYAYLA